MTDEADNSFAYVCPTTPNAAPPARASGNNILKVKAVDLKRALLFRQ